MTECYGNPSSLHLKGTQAFRALKTAREQTASAIGGESSCIYFTSGGTEANNLALFGAADAAKRRGRKIIISSLEHSSVLSSAKELKKQGFDVVEIFPEKGKHIEARQFEEAVDEETILVSCMSVNSETGEILPAAEAAELVKKKKRDVIFHCDHVQGFCKIPFNIERTKIDLLSLSGHKIHAPKGTGALYIKRGIHITARSFGGLQEEQLRPGTENMPGIAALGVCAELLSQEIGANLEKYRILRKHLLERIAAAGEDIVINSPADGAPHILNISVPGIRSEIMLHHLSAEGIYVSSGSACSRGAKSHVLEAMGLPSRITDSALRISMCRNTTEEELDVFADVLFDGMKKLIRVK